MANRLGVTAPAVNKWEMEIPTGHYAISSYC